MADVIVKVVDGRAVVRFSGPEAIATMLAEAQTAASTAANAAEEVSGAVEAAEEILEAIENSNSQLYPTVEVVQISDIPALVTAIRVQGYAVMGDGGASSWIEVANAGDLLDGQITTNGGSRRWELSPEGGRVHVAQFGAFPGLHLDEDTEALWDAFTTKPSLAHIRRIDFFVSELKKHGVWQKLDALYVFAAQSQADAFLNWKNPALAPMSIYGTGTYPGAPKFLRGIGFRGTGTSAQLTTLPAGIAASFPQFAQNNAHIGVCERGAPVAGQSSSINGGDANADIAFQKLDTGAVTIRMNDKTGRSFTNSFTERARHIERHGAHFIISRSAANGYTVDRNGYPLGAGTITDRTSTGVPTGPLNAFIYADSNTTDITAKVLQVVHVGTALDAIDRKILYQHVRDLLTDIPAVLEGPASTQAMVDGPSQTTTLTRQRMQAALNFAARKAAGCRLDRGVYLINEQLYVPSGSRVSGEGMKATTIRCQDDVSYSHNVLILGWYDNRRSDIHISDLTCDYNWKRRGNVTVPIYDPNGNLIMGNAVGSAVSISNCERVHVLRVGGMNPAKHCFDVTAPTYGRGLSTPLLYSPEPSRHITLEECWAYQGGDDNFTTHQCEDVRIVRCVSWSPQGTAVGENTNCYEIDEGSRNVSLIDSLGYGGICGLQIKGHDDSPAPYHIIVSGCRFINNINPIELRHSNWYGPASAAQTELDTIRGQDGAPYLSSGVSPTARNVMISDCQVIAPAIVPDLGYARDAGATMGIPVWVRAYENLQINNLLISEGGLDVAEDYWEATPLQDGLGVMRVYDGGRHTNINNLTISGFSYCDMGLYIPASLDGPMVVRGFSSINGPRKAVRAVAANILLDGFAITRDRAGPNDVFPTVGVEMTGAGDILGLGYITGYDQTVLGNPRLVYQPVAPYTVATFANSADGFTGFSGATLTPGAGGLTLSYVGGNNAYMAKSAGIAINGNVYRKVKIDIERTVARATGAWEGSLYYATAGHSFTGSYLKTIDNTNDMAVGERKTLTFDMGALTAGGSDWTTSTITGLRLDLETLSGGTFIVHSITIEP